MTTPTERRWLEYAWRVANCSPSHRRLCEEAGGASPLEGGWGDRLRWPGYLGRDYDERRGVLCVGAVHGVGTTWDEPAKSQLEASLQKWIDTERSEASDAAYLGTVREVFESWIPSWSHLWKPFYKRLVEDKLHLDVRQLAWTNLAKCRASDGMKVMPLCQAEYPITDVIEAIRPTTVLIGVKHAYAGGDIVQTWRSASANPRVWTWDGRQGKDPQDRPFDVWSAEVL